MVDVSYIPYSCIAVMTGCNWVIIMYSKMHMCIGLAYIILVPSRILIRKQPMRILLQSHDKPIYMDRPLNRGALNLNTA